MDEVTRADIKALAAHAELLAQSIDNRDLWLRAWNLFYMVERISYKAFLSNQDRRDYHELYRQYQELKMEVLLTQGGQL